MGAPTHTPDAAVVAAHTALISGFPAWFLYHLVQLVPGGLEAAMGRSGLPPERREDVRGAVEALRAVGADWRVSYPGSSSGTSSGVDPSPDVLSRRVDRVFLSATEAAGVLGVSSRRVRVLAEMGSLRGHRDAGGRWQFSTADIAAERDRRDRIRGAE